MAASSERPLSGDSVALTRRYLDHLLVEGRIVGAAHPTAQTALFGHPFETPITTGARRRRRSRCCRYQEKVPPHSAILNRIR